MKRYVLRYWMLFGLLALVGGVPVVGQGGYGKLIADENGIMRNLNIDDIVYHNDHLYVRGNKWIDSIGIWGLFVASLDTSGNLIWFTTHYDTSAQSDWLANIPTRFKITTEGKFLIPNLYVNTKRLAFTELNIIGEEIFTKSYIHEGRTIYPGDIIHLDGYNYLFGRVQRLDYFGDCYVVKTDSIGNFIWIKYYGLNDHEDGFGGVVQNSNSTFTISSTRLSKDFHLSGSQMIGWKSPWVFTIDTAGIIVDEWLGEINDTTTLGGGPFCKLNDNSWAVTSRDFSVISMPPGYFLWYNPTISKLDSNYNLVWKRRLFNHFDPVDKITDVEYDEVRDEIVVCGHQGIYYGGDHWEREIWVVKLDGEGNTIWDITDTLYSERRAYHQPGGLEIGPSGSIYLAGTISFDVHPNDGEQGWIMKVTPDGCTDTLCTTTSLEEQIRNWDKNVIFYPNPAQDILKVQIKDLSTTGVLQIFDLQGRIVKRQSVSQGTNAIDLDLISGIYVCTITSKGNIVYSEKIVVQ